MAPGIVRTENLSHVEFRGLTFESCRAPAIALQGGTHCRTTAHLDARGMGWQKEATHSNSQTLQTRLRAMPYQSALWRQRYPNLGDILADDPGVPKRNVFRRNISAGGIWEDIQGRIKKYQTIEDNLVFDHAPDWVRLIEDDSGKIAHLKFKDPQAVERINFQTLPLSQMGLYEDARRASWPVQHAVHIVEFPQLPPKANLPPNPTYLVPRSSAAVAIDGHLTPAEWDGLSDDKAILLSANVNGDLIAQPAKAWLSHDGRNLRVALQTPLPDTRSLGTQWGNSDAAELAFRHPDAGDADIGVVRAYTEGTLEVSNEAGASARLLEKLGRDVDYGAAVTADNWTAESRIPLENLSVAPGDRLRFNMTVRRIGGRLGVMWRPTRYHSYDVDEVGWIEFAP